MKPLSPTIYCAVEIGMTTYGILSSSYPVYFFILSYFRLSHDFFTVEENMLNSFSKYLLVFIPIHIILVFLTKPSHNIYLFICRTAFNYTAILVLASLVLYSFGFSYTRKLEETTLLSALFASYMLLPIIHYGNQYKKHVNVFLTMNSRTDYDLISKLTLWCSCLGSLIGSPFTLLDIDELWQKKSLPVFIGNFVGYIIGLALSLAINLFKSK